MKKIVKAFGALLVVCIVAVSFAGCGSSSTSSDVSTWQQVSSPDSSLQLKMPSDWQSDPSLNSDASIAYGNNTTGHYFLVIEEDASSFDTGYTVQQYAQLVHDNMATALDNPTISDVATSDTLDGGYQFDMSGITQDVQVHFMANFIENDNTFYQLIGYCQDSDYTATLPDFNNVFKSVSFTDASPNPGDTTSSASDSSAIPSDDTSSSGD